MKKNSLIALTAAGLMTPWFAFAQLGNIERIVESIGNLVDLATPIVVGIALLAFFWGLAKFIFSAGDPEAQKQGRGIMIWGIIALFVMVSVWGLVRFIGDALGIDEGGSIDTPSVQGL